MEATHTLGQQAQHTPLDLDAKRKEHGKRGKQEGGRPPSGCIGKGAHPLFGRVLRSPSGGQLRIERGATELRTLLLLLRLAAAGASGAAARHGPNAVRRRHWQRRAQSQRGADARRFLHRWPPSRRVRGAAAVVVRRPAALRSC